MSNHQTLQPLQGERYAAAYAVFLRQWQLNRQASIAIMQRHLQAAPANQPSLAILSVGAGPGDFDAQVVQMVQTLTGDRPVRYVAVEPNLRHRQRFTATMQAAHFPKVHFELLATGIEEAPISERFDCIHYTHSLYYMPGRERELMLAALQMLKPTGFLLITIDCVEAVMPRLIEQYLARMGSLDHQTFPPMIGAQFVTHLLAELGLSYEQTLLEEVVDVTPCFDPTQEQGVLLLDFIFHAEVSRSTRRNQELALALLAKEVCGQGPRKLIHGPAATIVIPQQ